MKTADHGIRKAAILVASLDRAAADAMLEALGPEQAGRLRQTMVNLGPVDPGERRRVVDEFFRATPGGPEKHPSGVELDGPLAPRSATPRARTAPSQSPSADPDTIRPFRFLHEAEVEKLARVLAGERPQTIALVLSHLPPEQAGGVLGGLQPVLQVDVIHRLVDLEETDPEILREVERGLESRLSRQVQMQRRRVAGLKAVTGILEASAERIAQRILDNLSAYDQPLAERLSPPGLKFDDLIMLEDATLDAIFRAAKPELAMTALVGAPPELIDRILRRFAAPEAKTVRHKLDHPGPIRLSDVEGARQQIADLAGRLVREGRIRLPGRMELVAA